MEKIFVVVQVNNSYDNTSSQILKAFKFRASASHYKHDKECEYVSLPHIYFYIAEIDLI